jgi:hypothetical protein
MPHKFKPNQFNIDILRKCVESAKEKKGQNHHITFYDLVCDFPPFAMALQNARRGKTSNEHLASDDRPYFDSVHSTWNCMDGKAGTNYITNCQLNHHLQIH